ncbi:hypothetical protein AUQ43_17200 [Thalassospira sp. MCCC 1A01148]|uniref:Uncharacterized protein n=1 Tax=Thalassospira profundimaris TaxID=502049 RepID=A0A367VDI8_9PROT|nr:hypothetical protein AUQ43_17200 [Thalassospira sp. MCCC 1A01148]RCK23274.1 hypothetical protein TH6_09675 [Thalassospira profundimaris]
MCIVTRLYEPVFIANGMIQTFQAKGYFTVLRDIVSGDRRHGRAHMQSNRMRIDLAAGFGPDTKNPAGWIALRDY